ncbi:hypothetical protein SAY86_007521 [Trapa natans]|uniref:Nuclear pore complex protein NUP88 n=1 Tax=Trapa natans TaxID=22666 RepID=A0AAN7LB21_TRANT|nr:hypothetical protein SAY86_007521 [Trapa natans]
MDPPACFSGITAGSAFIAIRLGEPDPASIVAASPSMELQADVGINFMVKNISINRNGSALCVTGADDLCVMYLYGQSSSKDKTLVCRTISVGSQIYFSRANTIHKVMWHPYSDTHLGVLSSDSVFRLFDLSVDLMQPEQEFYLQPVEPGRSKNATSLCPVDFTFGGDHLWDRLTVFILFSDGSIYIICPVVPFGSVLKWESIQEIYLNAQMCRLKSVNPITIRNSNLAISWLESTFPELSDEVERGKLAFIRACHNALFDASLSLQFEGTLRCHSDNCILGSVQTSGKEEGAQAPSVIPALNTCCVEEESSLLCSLCGSLALSGSFGSSWIIGVTSKMNCLVVEMKTWELLLPFRVDLKNNNIFLEDSKNIEVSDIISKELLSGPRTVLIPQAPSNLRSFTSNSIEGRSILHKYLNLFHEHYVENAHKVHFELKHHSPHLNRIIDDQHAGLGEAHQWLLKVEEKQKGLHGRIDHITMQHENLEQRLQCLRNLQCAHKGPLSRAERELKAEIDQFGRVELDALHSSIEALLVRSRRYMQSVEEEQTPMRKKPVQDAQISLLKSSIEKLSFVNSENVKKVKLVDSAIKNRGSGG